MLIELQWDATKGWCDSGCEGTLDEMLVDEG